MTARRRTAPAAAAGLALLGLLGGCAGSDPAATAQTAQTASRGQSPPTMPTMMADDGTSAAASSASYTIPTCPRLVPAAPVTGGLPDLRLPCLGGGPSVNLADLRGKPMVLNVWAAWCPNCDREMPLFADAMTRAAGRMRFFGVHYKAAEKFGERSAADFGVPFPSVHDEDGDRVVRALRTAAPPQTLFVTADGRVAGRQVGEIRSQAQLDELVQRYLGVRL